MAEEPSDSAPNAHLPDDTARWPYEPAKVLNVPADADAKSIKRAYAKLLRIYRPEDAPDAFQRLMAARDALLITSRNPSNTGWNRPSSKPPQPPPELQTLVETDEFSNGDASQNDGSQNDDQPNNASPSDHESTPENVGPGVRVHSPGRDQKRLAAAWNLAVEGDLQEAYAACQKLANEIPEAAIRAHWLLRLDPTLDDKLQPIDWLLNDADRLPTDTTLELLARWLEFTPEDSRDDRFIPLLNNPDFAEIVRPVRWREFARSRRFDLLEKEWDQCNWSAGHQGQYWTGFLLSVLTMRKEPAAVRLAQRCVADLSDVNADGASFADSIVEQQLDLYAEIIRLQQDKQLTEWREIRRILVDIPESPRKWQAYMNPLMRDWWHAPSAALDRLDELARTAPALGVHLFNEFRNHRRWDDPLLEERVEEAWKLVEPEVEEDTAYGILRVKVINICRTYAVAMSDLPVWSGSNNAARHSLSSDLAAHLLTLGWATYAAQM